MRKYLVTGDWSQSKMTGEAIFASEECHRSGRTG